MLFQTNKPLGITDLFMLGDWDSPFEPLELYCFLLGPRNTHRNQPVMIVTIIICTWISSPCFGLQVKD